MRLFIACPKGFEHLVEAEIQALSENQASCQYADLSIGNGGVELEAELAFVYHFSLATRVSTRLLRLIADEPCGDREELYRAARSVPWLQHLAAESIEHLAISVDFSGRSDEIRHSQFGAQVVKDGLVDQLRDHIDARPIIDTKDPDLRIAARLHKGRVTLAIDLSGRSLHQRGYRLQTGDAPLKENLAAAMLKRAKAGDAEQLADPMCGSGTFCIEFALLKLGASPRLKRREYGFLHWKQHDDELWRSIQDGYQQHFEIARLAQSKKANALLAAGFDEDALAIAAAKTNAESVGLSEFLSFKQTTIEQHARPSELDDERGLVITNPPYGERLGERAHLPSLYQSLSAMLKDHYAGWRGAVLAGDKGLADSLRMGSAKRYRFRNGPLENTLVVFEIKGQGSARLKPVHALLRDVELTEAAEGLLNRLKKNLAKRNKWLKRGTGEQPIAAYRLYDADLPEYASAVDVYNDREGLLHIHLQEYAAPKSVDPGKAKRRLADTQIALAKLFELDAEGETRLVIKARERQKGADQYQRTGDDERRFVVKEGRAAFYVDLGARLDTGLFLDHRPLRLKIASDFHKTRDRRFLNLFCYTASATVHAALGGAASSVSVDTSNTYLGWARDNFRLNAMNPYQHILERQDVWAYLEKCREGFDVIMLDPPTFSNNRSEQRVFDVQQDHAQYVRRCIDLLKPGGKLYFSCNRRKFRLDAELVARYKSEKSGTAIDIDRDIDNESGASQAVTMTEITSETIDLDFKRPSPIHRAWCFERKR